MHRVLLQGRCPKRKQWSEKHFTLCNYFEPIFKTFHGMRLKTLKHIAANITNLVKNHYRPKCKVNKVKKIKVNRKLKDLRKYKLDYESCWSKRKKDLKNAGFICFNESTLKLWEMFFLKNVIFWRRKSYVLNDLRNLNEVFRNNVTYEKIKRNKKAGLYPLTLKNAFSEKPQEDRGQVGTPSLFRQ